MRQRAGVIVSRAHGRGPVDGGHVDEEEVARAVRVEDLHLAEVVRKQLLREPTLISLPPHSLSLITYSERLPDW